MLRTLVHLSRQDVMGGLDQGAGYRGGDIGGFKAYLLEVEGYFW